MKRHTYFFVIFILSGLPLSLYAQDIIAENEILKAYELRISGKSEEAISILQGILEKYPDNAMANFEMARTVPDDQKLQYIEHAIKSDPENPMYLFQLADQHIMVAYVSMQEENNEKIKENVEKCCSSLKRVLKIKPDCKESLLFLVDLYGNLPPEMGGNKNNAEKYLISLKNVDPLYAAQGELYLAGDKVDIVEHWQTYIDEHGKSQEAMIKLGKANLMKNDIGQATKCFMEVIAQDPTQNELYLHIARAHLYNAMRGGPEGEKEIPEIEKNINKYLNSDAEKAISVEAWCYGWLGMIEEKSGHKEEADIYYSKARELMPEFPRYTALPKVDNPPNQIAYQFSSYFTRY